MSSLSEQLEATRQQIFTIAKKFDDNPGHKLTKEEKRIIGRLVPQITLQIDMDEQQEVLKALSVLELFTQPAALKTLEEGKSVAEAYDIAVREFAAGYAQRLLERLEAEGGGSEEPAEPTSAK